MQGLDRKALSVHSCILATCGVRQSFLRLSELPPLSTDELSRFPVGALKAFKAKVGIKFVFPRGRILLYASFTDSAHNSLRERQGRSTAGPKPAQFDGTGSLPLSGPNH
jgi:hypothetical protein